MFKKSFPAVLILWICISPLQSAENAQLIMSKVDNRRNARSEFMKMSMTIIDDRDDVSSARVFTVESTGSDDDSVMIFRNPKRLAGLSILSRNEGQWVYFPSTGRVRKLSGAARSGSVKGVGGDFSYEDLGSGKWSEDYKFILLENNSDSWVLEATPLNNTISYSHLIMTISKEYLMATKIKYFKKGSEPVKVLTIEKLDMFNGKLEPSVFYMESNEKNSRTIIDVLEMDFDIPLKKNQFHPKQFYR